MNIGDKVRMLRAKEEGVVTRFLSGNQVEIEIEDGFRIPVMRSELVVVSPLEAERLLRRNTHEPQKSVAPGILSNQGIYLAFVPQNDREMALHLINNTDWDLLYTVAEERGNQVRGLQSGILKPKSQVKLNELYTVAGFENWPTFLVQALWFRAASVALRPPLVKRLKCRAATFYKNKQNVPVLNQAGHLFQIDIDEPAPEAEAAPKVVAPEALKKEMLSPKSEPAAIAVERPSAVVDLHIEALLPGGPGKRSNSELLELQLQAFEKSLENAIASGMSDITFIHGVGSGALRNELHRRLGRHPHVRYYEDAQKQKFGYGATKVTIR
ncbi:hypothetical protein GCM10023189_60160 [Nibrella saemangeumensis]|uniref:Smr domain-containing protein n=1 Tax=Nibrella saemangeumensis TaxID=1084526 RepID=A0ABP8NTH1_9BACT